MVHKKYKWKNGKKYGPYYYENKRVGDKVVTTYLGRHHKLESKNEDKNVGELTVTSKKNYFFILGIILIIGFSFVFYFIGKGVFFSPDFKAIEINLDKENYNAGEQLKGNVLLNLRQGELIPIDSKVMITFEGIEKEISVGENVGVDKNKGTYYLTNGELIGSGEGYGIAGTKEIYPEIEFELILTETNGGEVNADSEENVSDGVIGGGGDGESSGGGNEGPAIEENTGETLPENEEGQIPIVSEETPQTQTEPEEAPTGEVTLESVQPETGNSETVQETTQEATVSDTAESSSDNGGDSSPSGESSGGTESGGGEVNGGEVSLSPNEEIISGKVRKGEDFIYEIKEGQLVKVKEGSVKVNGESVEDNLVELKIEDGKVIVSTTYAEIEEGFGEEFLGDEFLEIRINIDELGFIVNEEGSLDVGLIIGEREVLKTTKEIILREVNESIINQSELIETPINEAIINQTIVNETILNETIIETNVSNLTGYGAILGQPVKWVKRVEVLTGETAVKFDVPKSAEKLIAKKRDNRGREVEIEDFEKGEIKKFEFEGEVDSGKKDDVKSELNDSIINETIVEENKDDNILDENKNIGTGNEENENVGIGNGENIDSIVEPEISLSPEIVEGKEINVNVPINALEVVLEYETPAPYAIEEETSKGKIVNVIGPNDVHYENVLIFTNLNEGLNIIDSSKIRIIWKETGQVINVLNANDTNNNSIIDYIQFVAPSLSNQTFEIIVITKAEHLDQNRSFINDIFDSVKAQDGIWSEIINDGEYVRVTFEIPLDKTRDITLWPRTVSGISRVEVYEIDGNTTVASFESLNDNEYNKVYLTGLADGVSQDTFDLKVMGGSVELDHVIDPQPSGATRSCNMNGSASSTGVKCLNGAAGKNEDWTNGTIDSCIDKTSTPTVYVRDMWVNDSNIKSGDSVNVSCSFVGGGSTRLASFFYNDGVSGWINTSSFLYGTGSGNINITHPIKIANKSGIHYFRCWISSDSTSCNTTTPCCGNSMADNDDFSFSACGTAGVATSSLSNCCPGLIAIHNGTNLVCGTESDCSSYPKRYCQNATGDYGICVNYNATGSLITGVCDTVAPVASNSSSEAFLSCVADKWRNCDNTLIGIGFSNDGICVDNDVCSILSVGGKNDTDKQPDTLVANISCTDTDYGCFNSSYDGRTCVGIPITPVSSPEPSKIGIIAGNKSGGAGGNGDDASPCCYQDTFFVFDGTGDHIYGRNESDSTPYEGCGYNFPKDGLTCVNYRQYANWDGINDTDIGVSVNSTSCELGLVSKNSSGNYLNTCSGNENGTCDTDITLSGYVPDGTCYNTNGQGVQCETDDANGSTTTTNCIYNGEILPHGQTGNYTAGGNASILCANSNLYYCVYQADLSPTVGINRTNNCDPVPGTNLICQNAGVTKGLWLTTIFDGASCTCSKGTECSSGLCEELSGQGYCRGSCNFAGNMCSNNSQSYLVGGTCTDFDGCIMGPIYKSTSLVLRPGCTSGNAGVNICDNNGTGGFIVEGICTNNGSGFGVCDTNDTYFDDEAGIYYANVQVNMTNYTSELNNGGGFGDSCDNNVSNGLYSAVGMAVSNLGNMTLTCNAFSRTVMINATNSLYVGNCSLGGGERCDNSTGLLGGSISDSFFANGICVNNSDVAHCSTTTAARNNYTNGSLYGASLIYSSSCTFLANNSQCDLDVSDSYFNFTNNTGTTSGVCYSGSCVQCGQFEIAPTQCSGGIDDDCDGLIDSNDPNCQPPIVTINFPTNRTYFSSNLHLSFNVSLNIDTGSVRYSLDGGINNKTMYNSSGGMIGRYFNATNSSIADGNYTFRVYANDSWGNKNETAKVNFTFENTDLTGCKNLTYAGQTYRLIGDIQTTSTCFNILANNITLDGNGMSIVYGNQSGGTYYGVTANNFNDLIIKNLSVSRGTSAGSNDLRYGIYLIRSTNYLVKDIKANNNYYGIYLNDPSLGFSSYSNLNNIIANNNSIGINVRKIHSLNFNNIVANNNSNRAIYVQDASYNIFNNLIANYNNISVEFRELSQYSQFNTINTFDFNYNKKGIVLVSSYGNTISNGRINSTSGNAVEVFTSSVSFANYLSNVAISNTNFSFYDLKVSVPDIGELSLNNMPHIGNYSFDAGGNLITINNSFGEIKFLNGITGSGTNLTADVRIGNNSATVMSNINPGLNRSANITLYGIGERGFVSPVLLRDSLNCGNSCNNFTALNASEVRFNVTGWTDYSIGEEVYLSDCGVLNVANRYYRLLNNITTTGTCFIINATNVTLDGQGKKIIYGDQLGSSFYGVISNGYNNTIVKNVTISRGSLSLSSNTRYGIYYLNNINGRIEYVNTSSNLRGISLSTSSNNSILNNIANSNALRGILISGGSNNSLINNTVNNNGQVGIETASRSKFINNTVNNHSLYGIYVTGSYNSLILNTINNSNLGIYILGGNNNITNNTLIFNNDGITIGASSSNNRLENNLFVSNNFGIRLISDSVTNMITGGIINNSRNNAIDIGPSSNDNNFTNISILSTNKSFYDIRFNSAGINGNYLIDMPHIGNYSFAGAGGTVYFKNSQYGEIRFLSAINGSGTNLSNDVRIGNNSVTVLSNNNPGLNRSADITLYGIGNRGFTNPTMLRNGVNCGNICRNFTALNAPEVRFNVTSWTNYSIGNSTNSAPNDPLTKINSTDGSNRTKQDLHCFDRLLDVDNNTMNVSVVWYNNSIFKFQFDYNNSYMNGTLFNATLGHFNTTKGENWSCALRLYDGQLYSAWRNSTNLTILNSLPNATLLLPTNNNYTIDRTPVFNWSILDDDGDVVSSHFNLSCYSGCSLDNRSVMVGGGQNASYEIVGDLQYLVDDTYYYNWSVRANDSVGFGNWASDYRLNIQSYVAINLTRDYINFGSITIGTNDTTDDSPLPFLLKNIGNVFVNVSINASDLWISAVNPTPYYQFKVDNYAGQAGAFNWAASTTSFTSVPNRTIVPRIMSGFNYTDTRNTAEIDVNITVPPGEGAGVKSSIITFVASRT